MKDKKIYREGKTWHIRRQTIKMDFAGKFGGRFVQTLMTTVLELEEAYREDQADPSFRGFKPTLLPVCGT